jgi:hypothetical protein
MATSSPFVPKPMIRSVCPAVGFGVVPAGVVDDEAAW